MSYQAGTRNITKKCTRTDSSTSLEENVKKIFLHCPQLDEFPYPLSHPFNTSRAGKVRKVLDSMGLLSGADRAEVAPQPAAREVLEKFHTPEYLDALQRAGNGQFDTRMLYMGLGTGDCPVFEGVYDYGVLAAGATVTAAEKIVSGKTEIAFNPSGGYHHAWPDRASGFCYINDVVLGCMTLTEAGRRVLYLDVDVHHGDGVQNAFYSRSDVMMISMHQSGLTLFPGTGFVDEIGTGQGKGFSVNVPLPVGTYDRIYIKAFEQVALPLITAYGPDVIVMEIGADSLSGDPLANLSLTNNVYADIIKTLLTFEKPILATGGGGYDLENTVRAWVLAWCALCGDDVASQAPDLDGVTSENSDWQGGLRDRVMAPDKARSKAVDEQVEEVINAVKRTVFALHGL